MSDSVKQRPKFLTLTEIKMPIAAVVSILHRVSGAGLFLLLPWLVYLLSLSLGSPESFARFQQYVAHPLAKLFLFGLVWAYLHHFCAGIRFLLLDLHIGIDKKPSKTSASAVLAISLALTLILGLKLLGAY